MTDLNRDGSYDVWIGAAGQDVRTLINTYQAPDGLPANMPRNFAIIATGQSADTVTLRGGMTYTFWLQTAPSPVGPWQDLNHVSYDGAETVYVDPIPGWREDAARFYRLR